jgi:GTPase
VSAIDGSGTDALLAAIEAKLARTGALFEVTVQAEDGKGMAWLHRHGEVLDKKTSATGRTRLKMRMDADAAGQARARFGRAMRSAKA